MTNWAKLANQSARTIHKVLGDDLVYKYFDGDSIVLRAIIDHENAEVNLGIGINSSSRVFVIQQQDMQRKPMGGDLITYHNATFEVLNIVEDGITCYRIHTHATDTRHTRHGDLI